MSSARARFTPIWAFALASVAYGLFIYALLPERVVLLDDDFGYLKSIVQTLQHGRPWTNDFLEPWNAASSALSAAAFALTGNFYFATYGLQAILAGLALFALCPLLAARGFTTRTAIVFGILILSFPVMLCRALEYTGMILYVPCLIGAIWAAERRRWGVFALVWLLAATNRQSAVVWLVLPAYAAGRAWFSRSGGGFASIRIPLAVVVGGLGTLGLMHAVMNPTDAQQMLLYQTLQRFQFSRALHALAAGAIVFFVAVGFSATVQTLSRNPLAPRPAWRGLGLVAMIVVAITLLFVDERYLANPDHIDIQWRAGWAYSKLIVGLGLAGWIGFRFRVLPAPALCAAASVFVISLRANLGDYYFIDAALFGFFAVAPARANATTPERSTLFIIRYWKPALVSALGIAGVFHAQCALHLKAVFDEAQAVSTLYENALRAGKIQAHELRDAPFGYSGWHIYSHAISLRTNTQTRWVSRLLDAPIKSVELATAHPDSFPKRWRANAHVRPDPQIVPLAETTARVGWFWECRYVLQRRAPPLAPSPLGAGFRPIKFPLNNAEWRELIAGPSVR